MMSDVFLEILTTGSTSTRWWRRRRRCPIEPCGTSWPARRSREDADGADAELDLHERPDERLGREQHVATALR